MHALVVEDDPALADFLQRALRDEGIDSTVAPTVKDALEATAQRGFDIIVLDWMLPDGDGTTVATTLRERGSTTPILMLTARGEVHDRVTGLKSGADDYLVKPFEIDELLARVEALTRRSAYGATARLGPLEIDRIERKAVVDGEAVDLTGLEFRLLARLAQEGGRPVDRPTLLADVWDLKFDPGSGVVEVHVSRLRDKLGEHAWMVETVRGAGYRLRTERKRSEPPPPSKGR
jgi:DNA-binding response OmpR family regulator